MQPEFHSGAVTRPLSAILQLAMMGCPALRARGELAAGACAPVLGWDRRGSSSAGARAWWGACGTGARGPLRGVFGRLPLARLRESAFWGACTKYFRELTVECSLFVRQSLPPAIISYRSHPCRISGVEPTILAKVASMGLPSSHIELYPLVIVSRAA